MYQQPPATPVRGYLKWAAVDLDGTLAQGIWTPEDPTSDIGPPIERNVNKVMDLIAKGWKIHIHTARPWHDYERIEVWSEFWSVPYHYIHCGKLLAGIYVDDRAVHESEPVWSNEVRA